MPTHLLPITLHVNGAEHALVIEPRRTLLDALRVDLQLTGTKKVCDMGDCGACTVLVDGRAMYACLLLAVDCDGQADHHHRRAEPEWPVRPRAAGFHRGRRLPVRLLHPRPDHEPARPAERHPTPTEEQIRRAVSGNLCRCGAYQNIVRAGRQASDLHAAAQEKGMPILHIDKLRSGQASRGVQGGREDRPTPLGRSHVHCRRPAATPG